MVKIIDPAPKEFIGYCSRCGCKFSYELKDLRYDSTIEYVKCPECKAKYTHPLQRKHETITFNQPLQTLVPLKNDPTTPVDMDPWYVQPESAISLK